MLFLLAACERPVPDGEQAAALTRPAIDVAAQVDDEAFHVPEVVVVDFLDGTTKTEFDAIEQEWSIDLELASEEEGVDSAITVGVFRGDLGALLALIRGNPKVEAAEPLMRYAASYVPNDPGYGKQWNLSMINMPKAWDRSKGKGAVVAVLDTGVAYEDHDDFRRVPDLGGTTFVDGYDFVNKDRHANDDHGHGTHVAGTIAQSTNNAEGVAGVAFQAAIMPVKVLDHFGGGTSADIADAIRWAADHGANVINMSLGGGGRSAVMERAVEYARKKGVVVVCAAGNGGRGVVEYPAAYPGSVAVAAVGPGGQRAPYSSWGKELDLAAPGGDKRQGDEGGIVQNTIDPQDVSQAVYASYQGTSMATPHVAGVAALLFAAGARSPDQVEKALFASAHPPKGATGWTDQYGHGVIDAEVALKALEKLGGAAPVAELLPDEVQLAQPSPTHVAASSLSTAPLDWKPLAFAAVMLAFVLLTLARKERPGYLNVFASPGFLLPLLVSTMGVFVLRWLAPASELSASFALPLPDWLNDIIFGRGSLANPLVYSALVPTMAALVAVKVKGLRQAVGGLALGFAGILAYTVWAKAPALSWLPFTFLAMPWLVVNALICLFVARAMLKRETA
ncbi:MAG: peptidase S8 [Myxococcaceae bacterium]|nr:peptidase S8 [Myxococcaceae bacterium]MCA3013441.1 peptidase S8 [Myxococcaceae bacterium]